MKKYKVFISLLKFIFIIVIISLDLSCEYIERSDRKLQHVREQISILPDDYHELKFEETEFGISDLRIKKILNSLNNGSLKKFPTYKEALKIIDEIILLFSNKYIRKYVIGTSFEGREIEALQISYFENSMENKTIDLRLNENYRNFQNFTNNKPSFLLTSMHHSREPAGLTTGIYFISKFLEDALINNQTLAIHLLSNINIWYVPFVNPDGYVAIENTNNFIIRKNQRKTCNSGKPEDDGVDINRNYDYKFDNKDSSKCDPQEYSGEYPFSEPETRAIRDLVIKINKIKTAVNLHTFGDLWTIPWNCCKNKQLNREVANIYNELKYEILISSPSCVIRNLFQRKGSFFFSYKSKGFDISFFSKFRDEFEEISKFCFSPAPKNPAMNYEATGEADDYLLARHNIISLSPEIGSDYYGFYPPPNEIIPIAQKYYAQILAVASKTTVELSVTAILNNKNPMNFGNENEIEVSLFNSGLSSICSDQDYTNETLENHSCDSTIIWKLITSNCKQTTQFEPGSTKFEEYAAGFRYRTIHFENTVKNSECLQKKITTKKISIINNSFIKHPENINGFAFPGFISSRSKKKFRIYFNNSEIRDMENELVLNICIANTKYYKVGKLCYCGSLRFSVYNYSTNSALSIRLNTTHQLCNQLHINKQSFLKYNIQDYKEQYGDTEKNKVLLKTNFVYNGQNSILLSIFIVLITFFCLITLIYTVWYRRISKNIQFKSESIPKILTRF